MDLIQDFLKSKGPAVVSSLVSKLGVSSDQANGLLGEGLKRVMGLVTGGQLDIKSLLGGDGISAILSKLDLGALAGAAGVSKDQAEAGVKEMAPAMKDFLNEAADSPESLLGMLGGGESGGALGSIGKLAGKFFNK